MWWGDGDTSKLTEHERKTLNELRRLVETGHLVGLSPEQTKVALAAVTFYQNMTAATGLIAGARNVALFVGSLFVMYWAAQETIVSALKKLLAGG